MDMETAFVHAAAGIIGVDGLFWQSLSSLPSSSSSPSRKSPFDAPHVMHLVLIHESCITARRRRRQGMTPYRGTGWAGGRTPAGHAPAQYTGAQPYYGGDNQYNNQPPVQPAYSPPPNGNYYGNQGANQTYFGGQQSGVELQSPNNTYQPPRGGDQVYSPPTGPPPSKDGIVR
ncbi:MAG: hypothetical protein L6R41_004221 [Letrouitia leprolyta]|nr:MAG: hypothetical protein L6R41_004221 [Letrouitia leprolyta]